MKKSLTTSIAIFFITLLFSCGGKEDPTPSKTPEQIAIEKIAGESGKTWIVTGGSVTHKGLDETTEWTDFEITFSSNSGNKAYTTTNNNNLFDNSGSWAFAGSNYDKIILTGNQPAADQEISTSGIGNSNLNLEFNVPAPVNSRVNALAGDYRFELKAK